MIRQTMFLRVGIVGATLIAASVAPGAAVAQKPVPQQIVADTTASTEKAAVARNDVIQLLLTMKTDKNGNISRDEFIKLAQAEFDLVAGNENGVVCAKDLVPPDRRTRPTTFVK